MISNMTFMFIVMLVVFSNSEVLTFNLTGSTTDLVIWSTAPTNKIFKDTPVPQERTKNRIKVYLAKNEVEPLLLVLNSNTDREISITFPDFGNENIFLEVFEVMFIPLTQLSTTLAFGEAGKEYPDPLYPFEKGSTVNLVAGENKILWINVKVPAEGVEAGEYTDNIVLESSINVEIRITVFNFVLPSESSIKGALKYRDRYILEKYGVPDETYDDTYREMINITRTFLLERKQTPEESIWPSSISQGGGTLSFDCEKKTVYDSFENQWGFEYNAKETLLEGVDGKTFPSYVVYFGGSSDKQGRLDPRPAEFCGVTRTESDWLQNEDSEFNTLWGEYLKALQDYLEDFGVLDKIYLQLADEPSSEGDFEGLSWYSQEIFKHAPKLRTYITEDPKSDIWERNNGKIHAWCNELSHYDPKIAYQRRHYCLEENWVYFLRGDTRSQPLFSPIAIDQQGFESKLVGWWLWRFRVTGITYYSYTGWNINPWTNPRDPYGLQNGENSMIYPPNSNNDPIAYGETNKRMLSSIRAELLRDGLEDYEYLFLLNEKKHPDYKNQHTLADLQALKIVTGYEGYNRNDDFLYALRKNIGLYLGGESESVLDFIQPAHNRGTGDPKNFYINFQDPLGNPADDPLIVDGKTWMKIGWQEYDTQRGYGWIGQFSDVKTYYGGPGSSIVLQSMVYCNNAFQKVFLFVLPNGGYTIKIGSGFPGYNHRHNFIRIQGVLFINDEDVGGQSENANGGYFERTRDVYITNNMLILEMGIQGEFSTMNYLKIEANGKEFFFNNDTIVNSPPSDYGRDSCPILIDESDDTDNDENNGLSGGEIALIVILSLFGGFGLIVFVIALVIIFVVVIVVVKRKS